MNYALQSHIFFQDTKLVHSLSFIMAVIVCVASLVQTFIIKNNLVNAMLAIYS